MKWLGAANVAWFDIGGPARTHKRSDATAEIANSLPEQGILK
jgi:hypothetical protein